jgi:hypothetical protein
MWVKFRFPAAPSVATPTGRERMGSPALQTLQYPILLLPWLCFRGGPNPHLPHRLTGAHTPHLPVQVVQRRLAHFHEQIAPLRGHFAARGLLVEFEVLGGMEHTTPRLMDVIYHHVAARERARESAS